MRPSWYHGPLPQMKPLPIHVRAMIHSRRMSREKRIIEFLELNQRREELVREAQFEEALARIAEEDGATLDTVFHRHQHEWGKVFTSLIYNTPYILFSTYLPDKPLVTRISEIHETFKRDDARLSTPYSPEMLRIIKQARREKIANKTRELERERRGVMTPRKLRRQRQGPPSHVLANLTDRQKHMDKVARSVSEIGYVAQVKKALGFKLRNAEAWDVEDGPPGDRPRLDRMLQEIDAENLRRRAKWEENAAKQICEVRFYETPPGSHLIFKS
ncbi:uncharacterized protein FIBRA_06293 [Fibroporia radiculosa]|uniref:Uncharacterized protein n=1 Tax=Fibroporia radiculosa TaxID=599839 RepID=J4HYW0_9APHY|nr:uncharacterized protein FIBRA_06293 [Fibroporia radiculosa]CCM04132.1 predicted protein [Fibroporia radiculosa]